MLTTADRFLRTAHSPQRNSCVDELTFVRAPPAGAHAIRAVILPGARGAHSLPNE